ncbi:hypothetical protein [Bacillus toyonensis]|uniref:hypothetical protein n=1 Tax=Bacillus toyonensis TaxID=155322 RepID=UPI000BF2F90A|nr:hypothetical protein [Bacillus toyonensis]PGF05076.1 hypothetical protein COM61_01195 [Bacillus toyonensis]
METGLETQLSSILATSKVLSFKEFQDSLDNLVNEENKRSFKMTTDTGSRIQGYILSLDTEENRSKLKVNKLGKEEHHLTFVPSIVKCISQKQEGVFTVFYETSIVFITVK